MSAANDTFLHAERKQGREVRQLKQIESRAESKRVSEGEATSKFENGRANSFCASASVGFLAKFRPFETLCGLGLEGCEYGEVFKSNEMRSIVRRCPLSLSISGPNEGLPLLCG